MHDQTDCMHDLGIIMDASLDFKQHIAAVCCKGLAGLSVLFNVLGLEIWMLCFMHM